MLLYYNIGEAGSIVTGFLGIWGGIDQLADANPAEDFRGESGGVLSCS